MVTQRSRKTSKRTVIQPRQGDRGDSKRSGDGVRRLVRKLTRG